MPDLVGQAGLLIKGTAAKASEVFDEQGELANVVIPNFFKVRSDDGAQYNVTGLSGPGILVKRTEQGAYNSGRRYKTNDTNYVHTTYSKELEVSMEQLQDRDFDSVWDEIKQLRKAADFWKQYAAFQVFNGGFSTVTGINGVDLTRYGDGLALKNSASKILSDFGKTLIKWVTLSKQAIALQLQRLSERTLGFPEMRQSELYV